MRIASAFLLVVLASCGADEGLDQSGYTATDSAGIQIVESFSPAWDDSIRLVPEPLLRIGEETEGPYQFGYIGNGLLLPDGQVAITEGTALELRIFDANGRHVSTFGRSGNGPGEFRSMTGLFAYPGDSLAIADQILRRTTIFPLPSGSPRTIQHQGEGYYSVFGLLPDGRFLLYDPGSGYRPDLPPGLQWVLTDILAMDSSDGSWRVVAELPSREQRVEPDGNARAAIPARWAVHGVAEDGFYWATPDRYEIRLRDGEGTVRRIIRRPVQPRPVEPAMVEAYVESELDRMRESESDAAVASRRSQLEEGSYGEHVPLFSTAFVDRDQRLWLSQSTWPSRQEAPVQWSVFSRDGIWLGDLEAPERLKIVDSRGDLVLGIWQDDFDVPHVQLHRLLGAGGE